jgi:hypothetical protein
VSPTITAPASISRNAMKACSTLVVKTPACNPQGESLVAAIPSAK